VCVYAVFLVCGSERPADAVRAGDAVWAA
jgi:hypothetical protein